MPNVGGQIGGVLGAGGSAIGIPPQVGGSIGAWVGNIIGGLFGGGHQPTAEHVTQLFDEHPNVAWDAAFLTPILAEIREFSQSLEPYDPNFARYFMQHFIDSREHAGATKSLIHVNSIGTVEAFQNFISGGGSGVQEGGAQYSLQVALENCQNNSMPERDRIMWCKGGEIFGHNIDLAQGAIDYLNGVTGGGGTAPGLPTSGHPQGSPLPIMPGAPSGDKKPVMIAAAVIAGIVIFGIGKGIK